MSDGLGNDALSPRELEIARAYARGASYREIAERLLIAPTTVRTHLSTIYRKLGVSSKIELLRTLERTGAEPESPGPRDSRSAGRDPASLPTGKRQVVVLSALLDGLSEITERLDPEATAELLQHFRRVVEDGLEKHGGWFLGGRPADLTACFGLPAAQETDAERAVQCSLEINERLAAGRASDMPPIRARIGLYTGPVVTTKQDPGAAALGGAAPDLAAALAREATGGGIVVCGQTRASLGNLFAFSEIGPIALESGSDTKSSYAVTGRKRAETRFEALRGYRLTPIVGREHEVGLLADTFSRARDGSGHVALVAGEAGIGKSRVVKALCDRLSLRPGSLLVFQCSPHETASPLHPVVRALRNAADVERHETAKARLEAIVSLFADLMDDPLEDRKVLADLASIPYTLPPGRQALSPQKRRDRTLELLDRFVRSRAGPEPLLLIFEDMHWADPTTATWFERIAAMSESLPLLAVATYRTEAELEVGGGPNASSLALARLTRRETAQIVANQAGGRTLPAATVARIAERSEGNPLFAEELTRSFIELGETEDAIPVSLQASLMGRLDRLGAAREVAQAAAVVGREFSRDLLAEILDHGRRALDRALEALLASQLVHCSSRTEREAFQFKHALVRDAAYDSLLKSRRRLLHQRVAEALIDHFPDTAKTEPEVLAQHFTAAGRNEPAARYWQDAGRRAAQHFAHAEAVSHFTKGLEAIGSAIDAPEQADRALALLLGLLASLRILGRYDDALDALDRAEALATRDGRALDLANIHYLRGNIFFPLGDADRCRKEHEIALTHARDAGSAEFEARALGGLADADYLQGRMVTAFANYDHCIDVCRSHGFANIEVANLPMRAWGRYYQSDVVGALDDCLAGIDGAARDSRYREEMLARAASCFFLWEMGDFETSRAQTEIASDLARRLGARNFEPFCLLNLAIIVADEDSGEATRLAEQSVEICREAGVAFVGPWALGSLALVSRDRDQRQKALDEGERLLGSAGVAHCHLWFYRHAIDASLASAEWDDVARYASALEAFTAQERLPCVDFFIARGRALAAHARDSGDEATRRRLVKLRDKAARHRFVVAKRALDDAVAAI